MHPWCHSDTSRFTFDYIPVTLAKLAFLISWSTEKESVFAPYFCIYLGCFVGVGLLNTSVRLFERVHSHHVFSSIRLVWLVLFGFFSSVCLFACSPVCLSSSFSSLLFFFSCWCSLITLRKLFETPKAFLEHWKALTSDPDRFYSFNFSHIFLQIFFFSLLFLAGALW